MMSYAAPSSRRRVLYIQGPTGGGSALSLYELVRGLDKERFEPIVLFLIKSDYQQEFEALGIEVITLPPFPDRFERPPKNKGKISLFDNAMKLIWRDIPVAREIRRILKHKEIDLLHQNVGFDRGVMLATRTARIPQVFHFRNFGGVSKSAKLLFTSRQSHIFVSEAIAKHFHAKGVPHDRGVVIYDAIDIDRYAAVKDAAGIRQEFSVADNEYLITNVGRITPWKGQQYFLEAMAETAKRFNNIKVLVVGKPKSEKDHKYMTEMQDFVANSALKGKVWFTGLRADIPEIMAASDVVVHSASRPEPFGRVIPEAMAAGTPVIATNAGGVPEIIEDGVNGLLVPCKDINAMAVALEKLLESADLRQQLAARAHTDAANRYSVERHIEEIQKLYDSLLST